MKKRVYGISILVLLFHLLISISFSHGKHSGVCISQGGHFEPFSSEGKPPKKASKGQNDLTPCRVFRKMTCCDAAQTHPAFLSIRRLASTGEASQDCLHLWELLECSICDPIVGIQPPPPRLCASFCDRVYQACSNAYFAMDVKTLTSCYGAKASLEKIADSWKASQSKLPQKSENIDILEDFQQWVEEMQFSERVSWAVGGLVLTAGLLFVSKRRIHSQRQRLAAIQCAARKLERSMNQTSPRSQGNRKGNR